MPVPKGHVKQALRSWAFSEWSARWRDYSSTTSLVKSFFPSLQLIRRSIWSKGNWHDSICRLFLGRSPLAEDHWWVVDDTSFNCHCGSLETTTHFLFDCPIYSSVRSWEINPLLPTPVKLEWLGHRPTELKQPCAISPSEPPCC